MEERREARRLGWLAVLPPLLLTALVWFAASDVPYWDEWDLAPFLAEAKAGTIAPSDYFDVHGVHRYVLPKFILTQVAIATGWNVRVQILMNLMIAMASFGLIAIIAAPRRGTRAWSVALIGSSLAFFSLSQYDGWLWGWLVGFFLSIALMIAAIVVLARTHWSPAVRIALAALLCALATFSVAFGIVSWIALAPLVWIESPRPKSATAAWVLVGAACVALYRAGPSVPLQQIAGYGGPVDIALFFLAVTGTPWTSLALPALLLGAAALALFAWLTMRGLRIDARAAMPWISLGLLALGFAGLAAIIRSRLGWGLAMSPRYATPMVLLTVATVQLAALAEPLRWRLRISSVLTFLLILVNLSFLPIFWNAAAGRHVSRVCVDLAFFLGPARAECPPSASPLPGFLDRLEMTHDQGLRPFADSTWFFVPDRPAEKNVRVTRRADQITIDGRTRSPLLPEPVLITSGPDREPVAFVWPDDEGFWTARLDRGGDSDSLLEIWTMPRHEKRLVRIGSWDG